MRINKGLGDLLKSSRKAKQLSLDEVVDELKIQKRYIIAMEEEKFDELPGKTYEKGFLRNYANLLEIEVDYVMELYSELYNLPTETVETIENDEKVEKEVKVDKKSKLFLYLGVSVFAIIIIIISSVMLSNSKEKEIVVTKYEKSENLEIENEKNLVDDLSEAELETTKIEDQTVENKNLDKAENIEETKEELKEVKIETVKVEEKQVTETKDNTEIENKSEIKTDINTKLNKLIKIKINGNSWIDLKINGRTVIKGIYKDTTKTYKLKKSDRFYIKVGNGSAVEYFLNGENMGTFGNENKVVRKRL